MTIVLAIFFIFILVVLFIYIDYLFWEKRIREPIAKGAYPVRHSDLEIFADGPSLFTQFFRDLQKAENHIHILFYILRNDSFGNQLQSILIKKAEEGVKVRLLLDWVGSLSFPRKKIKILKNYGIEVAFSHRPYFPNFFFSLQKRNHRKITVIDGKIGYLGGFNVGKEYINQDKILSPWRDYHLRFIGEGVSDLQKQFLHDWSKATGKMGNADEWMFPHLEKGEIKHQFFATKNGMLETLYSELIEEAKNEIIIGTPYFIPGKTVFDKLIAALERGVQVKILVPGIADHLLVKEAAFRYFRKLIQHGCHLFQYKQGFYHAKILLIDRKITLIGTANFDQRSFYLNEEMVCYFADEKVFEKMDKIVQKDLANAHEIDWLALNQTNWLTKTKERIAEVLSPLL